MVEITAFEHRILRDQAEMLKEYQKLASDQYVQIQTLTKLVTQLKLLNAQSQTQSKQILHQMTQSPNIICFHRFYVGH